MQRIRLPLTRRSFLGGLATLPAWAAGEQTPPPSVLFRREPAPVLAADQVLNVMDFEPLARAALPPAHYGYIATGVDDDLTVVRNHDAFEHYQIRARRFVDLSHLDTALRRVRQALAKPAVSVGGVRDARLSPRGGTGGGTGRADARHAADAVQRLLHAARGGEPRRGRSALAAAVSDR